MPDMPGEPTDPQESIEKLLRNLSTCIDQFYQVYRSKQMLEGVQNSFQLIIPYIFSEASKRQQRILSEILSDIVTTCQTDDSDPSMNSLKGRVINPLSQFLLHIDNPHQLLMTTEEIVNKIIEEVMAREGNIKK